jgi:hypothetical protein
MSKEQQYAASQAPQGSASAREERISSSANAAARQVEEGRAGKKKASWFIDEDFFYSSEFKRNFVKGMMSLAVHKSI